MFITIVGASMLVENMCYRASTINSHAHFGVTKVIQIDQIQDTDLLLKQGSSMYKTNIYTVKPALKTTCIQRPPLYKDHLVVSE